MCHGRSGKHAGRFANGTIIGRRGWKKSQMEIEKLFG
jgi:hypothetical protein